MPKKNYPIYDLEALAALEAILYFKDLLEAVKFELVVDNRALSYIMGSKELTGRLARTVLILNNYRFEIRLVKSEENFFADFLSRHAGNGKFTKTRPVENGESFEDEAGSTTSTTPKLLESNVGVTTKPPKYINAVITRSDPFKELKRAQSEDPPIAYLLDAIERGEGLMMFELDRGVLVENSEDTKRPYIPEVMREELMAAHHDIPIAGHLGVEKTTKKNM